MKNLWTLALVLCLFSCKEEPNNEPFLSSLQADKESALYTTYAAAMKRSEFVVDEGYEFRFFEPTEGIGFTTDTSGELGVGFVIGGQYIFKESDMYKAPVITTSYPDLVRYTYYPVEGLEVSADFVVHSSRIAFWDLNILNKTGEPIALEVIPFIRNDYRSFNDVNSEAPDFFSFTHESFPDGWTVSHNMPYERELQNVFLISEPAGEKKVFNSLEGESPRIPFPVNLDEPSVFQVSGRALVREEERLIQKPPLARMQIYLDGDRSLLLTENSPLLGMAQPTIDEQGYFRMELGNFANLSKGSTFTFTFFSEPTSLGGRYTETIEELPGKLRRDLQIASYDLPAVPEQVSAKQEGDSLSITWKKEPSLVYHVYRRDYPGGVYKRIAANIESNSFTDRIVPGRVSGYVVVSENPETGDTGMHSREVNNLEVVSFKGFVADQGKPENHQVNQFARLLAFKQNLVLESGQEKNLRVVRAVGRMEKKISELEQEARSVLQESVEPYVAENEELFSAIPPLKFKDPDKEMLYWSGFNMMRQVFYPPEGESKFNYYVFSREPTWGWGHGGQVFHESITMLAYAYMDPVSAMNSQRIYSTRQHENGYINYRSGSYLNEVIRHNGQLTSSAPWYAWQNWEIYKITKDKTFLREMYDSSKKFYNFYVGHRDSDDDGLAEWGGHAVLESVRDALVAVWDEVGWPANFEGVDLNSMLVSEAKALENMALELGLQNEAAFWRKDYESRSDLINDTFWDSTTGFYYNADKKDNDFTFSAVNDLKREEIIGFLPLWAGIATPEQAKKLVEKLTDSNKFWRKYGVPSLAADDPYYNDKGYWNGPVWVEWNFLIIQGLLHYGYKEEARELVDRVAEGMILQLEKNHNLWEFYSPDEPWAGYHKTYIWAGIINRMMMDVHQNHEK